MYIHVFTWTDFVCTVLWLFSIHRPQIALEEELGTCIPTVLQVNIKTILLNAVRIGWKFPGTTTTVSCAYQQCISAYIQVYTNIYINIP